MKRVALVAALGLLAAVPASAARGPLRTAVFGAGSTPLVFARIHQAGATVVRINVSWRDIASSQPVEPTNPADPAYHWKATDRQVELAVKNRLQPLLTVLQAPQWAEKNEPHPTYQGRYPIDSWKPDPAAFGAFARALTLRYGGSFQGLPRVRYWEVWDEPNLSQYLSPQIEHGKLVSPEIYRSLVNAFTAAAHAVHPDNLVAAGSLSAFSFESEFGRLGIAPMIFMRKLLCMSTQAKPTCSTRVAFDAWSHHPWTSGGPTHKATEKNDISFGDLPEMQHLLTASVRAGHVIASRSPQFWITEFAWDTRPPDPSPQAAPMQLQARWVAEALHRSWQLGITMFTWLTLWDQQWPQSSLQSGLFYRNGEDFRHAKAKPTFSAFRFPFVAYRQGKRVSVWGRTPLGRPGRVAVQQRDGSHWSWLGRFRTDRYGVFSGHVRYRRAVKQASRKQPAASAARYRDLVVSAAPTSYWPLDEQSGPTASDVMRNDDGAYEGSVRLGVPGALPGTTAIALDGKTAKVALGQVENVRSVELWLKGSGARTAAAFSNRDRFHRYTFLGANGGLAFAFDDYSIFGDPVENGRWHQVVYTYDPATTTGKLYVDGVLSSFAVYARREGGAPASIGYDASLDAYLKAQIDEVAVYPYVLSQQQVRSHYLASGRVIPPAIPSGVVRAVELRSGVASLPFSLHRPPDRFVVPFGS